ncbi:DNA gyrase inhibitor [Ruminiclostridium hungatei]|uniref:DNA gyrase inhibitor n=1 Tax=Ruminiclostridium hungatei TaxID=48256 RepID=A0A1V4SI33_RUMHU|nr:GyrI-like domain-containing protein [Ruminiclostridium hungatei]OPX42901.1 DNA gyrase inhibitor [Ruminiclostridium hungatei]
MDITIERLPSYGIAYMRKTGPYGAGNVQVMEELKAFARDNRLLDDKSVILGIPQDNPETTRPENCRYDACLVLPEDCENRRISGGGVSRGNIHGGKYAVFRIPHTAQAVQEAWSSIFPELLAKGYGFDASRPVMERYAARLVNKHFCELCVPIY